MAAGQSASHTPSSMAAAVAGARVRSSSGAAEGWERVLQSMHSKCGANGHP